MDNNNKANITEENSNNTKLYLGIGAIMFIAIGLFFWWYAAGSKQNDDNEKIAKEVSQLIERGYLTKALDKDIKAYHNIDASNTQEKEKRLQELKDEYLKNYDSKSYEEKKGAIEKLQAKMSGMMAHKEINELLKNFEKIQNKIPNSQKNSRITNLRSQMHSIAASLLIASQRLLPIKNLNNAKEKLDECQSICKKQTGLQDIVKQIDQQKEKIDHILSYIPNDLLHGGPGIEEYDPEALKKALDTWNKDYQEIWDSQVLLEVLKTLDE